jgi:hypothetical protein
VLGSAREISCKLHKEAERPLLVCRLRLDPNIMMNQADARKSPFTEVGIQLNLDLSLDFMYENES